MDPRVPNYDSTGRPVWGVRTKRTRTLKHAKHVGIYDVVSQSLSWEGGRAVPNLAALEHGKRSQFRKDAEALVQLVQDSEVSIILGYAAPSPPSPAPGSSASSGSGGKEEKGKGKDRTEKEEEKAQEQEEEKTEQKNDPPIVLAIPRPRHRGAADSNDNKAHGSDGAMPLRVCIQWCFQSNEEFGGAPPPRKGVEGRQVIDTRSLGTLEPQDGGFAVKWDHRQPFLWALATLRFSRCKSSDAARSQFLVLTWTLGPKPNDSERANARDSTMLMVFKKRTDVNIPVELVPDEKRRLGIALSKEDREKEKEQEKEAKARAKARGKRQYSSAFSIPSSNSSAGPSGSRKGPPRTRSKNGQGAA